MIKESTRIKQRIRQKRFNQTPKGIFHTLVNNSKKREMPMEVTQFDFVDWYITKAKVCYYCGFKPTDTRLTIERLDNDLPYRLDNMELACKICNAVRSNILTVDEMLIIGKTVIAERWKS